MSRWAHWLSTWNRICHCSFVSNRSFLLFSNEYLILWIGGRNFLFSLYFPLFFLYFAGGDFEIATSIISRFTAHKNEIPYHIFGLFYIHIFVDNLSDKRLISLEPISVPSVLALSQRFPQFFISFGFVGRRGQDMIDTTADWQESWHRRMC